MLKKIILVSLFVLILGLSLAYLNLSHYMDTKSNNNQTVNLIIPRGYSIKQIGKELVKLDLISYPKVFWLAHRMFFQDLSLQAGEYEIPPYTSIREILNMMHEGKVVIHKLTLPEAITTKEIITKIKNEKMLIGEITKEFNEGDFIADTYYYTYGESKMMFLNRVYKKSQILLDELWAKRLPNLPLANKQEAVILASIVEKETGLASERRRIARVFINRLNKKMRLQADPTVIYALTQGQYLFNRSITLTDLKIKSLYNTYLYPGLPPTAIGNPGVAAIEAVLNPLPTTELYFVADGKGGHNFSSNLKDHNQHVSNYRKAKKEENNNAQ